MDIDVYCDESRPENLSLQKDLHHKYFLVGGIWVKTDSRQDLKNKIKQLRDKHNIFSEFKWNRVSDSKLPFYLDIIKLFFDSPYVRFRCVSFPIERINCMKWHDGDAELMFYKFYYVLIKQWIWDNCNYNIFLDLKVNRKRNRLPDLKSHLQSSNRFAEILNLQALPSDEVDLLQLADVLIGAVGYYFHRCKSSSAKLAVMSEIERYLSKPIEPTSPFEKKFNIFRWTGRGEMPR